MKDFKTRFNPLIPLGRLGVFSFYMYLFRTLTRNESDKYLIIILGLSLFGIIYFTLIKPFVKTTKNYLIKDNSIEEFNLLTSKTKSIDKNEIKGFSTSIFPYRIWEFKEIIIYLKDGAKINIMQFAYFNFKNIETTLIDKKYNYLGQEPYEWNLFKGRIYKYDDYNINSDLDKKPNNAERGNNYEVKIKLVFVPYLIISLAILIGWTFLYWLLFIKLNVYPVNELVSGFITPLVLASASILIWLYKKIDLLRIQTGDLAFYLLLPCFTMVLQVFFAQQYIISRSGKVTNLSSISEIEQKESSRFYTLKNFYLDKKHFSIKKHFGASGKFGNNLTMGVYITVPILNSVKDTLGSNSIGWYGVTYTDTAYGFVSDHLSFSPVYNFNDISMDTIENSAEVKRFVNESMMKFENLNINQFLYLERIFKTGKEYECYVSAIKNNTKYHTKSDLVLLPVDESLAERANENLLYGLAVFGIGSLLFLIMVIIPKLKSEDEG